MSWAGMISFGVLGDGVHGAKYYDLSSTFVLVRIGSRTVNAQYLSIDEQQVPANFTLAESPCCRDMSRFGMKSLLVFWAL